ncbi:MAG: hypothetical protein QOE79_3 [Sphingomonadales bacterium]|jgi:hypothetical protein|nr:hypothetical protein [Sphingomonadales bacterium]
MPTRYRVLDEAVTREEFAEAAAALGLALTKVFEADDEHGYEEIWANSPQMASLNYAEDPFVGLNYVAATGGEADNLLAALSRKLNFYSPDELIEEAHSANVDHNDRVANLYQLGVTFPEYDKDVRDIFENYATLAPHPKLRTAALDAIGLRSWSELRPVVERVARDDVDVTVRDYAKALLARWDTIPPG